VTEREIVNGTLKSEFGCFIKEKESKEDEVCN
jgi:hypothetical protein